MPSGVLWVASRVKKPGLTPEGSAPARYEGIKPSPFSGALSDDAPWLTVYEMPDINFRDTKEFRGLDGQSEPEKGLLEGIFKQARFDTAFYECIQVHEREGGATKCPASLIISAALTPAAEHLPLIGKCPGYRRTQRFKVINATVLDEFKRIEPQVPTWLTLHEFDGEELPMADLAKVDETEWSKKIIAGLQMTEAGFYRLKRTYDTGKESKL